MLAANIDSFSYASPASECLLRLDGRDDEDEIVEELDDVANDGVMLVGRSTVTMLALLMLLKTEM